VAFIPSKPENHQIHKTTTSNFHENLLFFSRF
jgi:hypothetical protein